MKFLFRRRFNRFDAAGMWCIAILATQDGWAWLLLFFPLAVFSGIGEYLLADREMRP